MPIEFVSLYVYCPWSGMPLAPYEVWLSPQGYGDSSASAARKCAGPVRTEPSNGEATMVSCGGLSFALGQPLYLTVKQVGTVRGMYLSEISVHTSIGACSS